MKIETTYGMYNAIMKVMDRVSHLAQAGDPEALEVVHWLTPAAKALGGQLRQKLALAIAEMEAIAAGPNPVAASGLERRRKSACRVRAS